MRLNLLGRFRVICSLETRYLNHTGHATEKGDTKIICGSVHDADLNEETRNTLTHTRAHTHIYVYIYLYVFMYTTCTFSYTYTYTRARNILYYPLRTVRSRPSVKNSYKRRP